MLEKVKVLLGITDTDLDKKLELIISSVKARLKILLGGIEPPEDMEHIIVEVSVIRFNRIGSEGFSSHTVEGESHSLVENDFFGFQDEVQAFLDSQKNASRGKVRFL